MIEMRLLGGLDLRGRDLNQVRSVLAQPRRAALLAYLAVRAPAGLERRDRLATLFWPDADPSAARQSLRQALAFIRRALGDDVFISNDAERGAEEVGVDPLVVHCDVHAFDRLIDSGELARAVEAYGGDFLAGFADTGVHGFEHWRDETGDRLRERMRTALRTLSGQAAGSNRAALVAHWARRELELDPTRDTAVDHAIRALRAVGDDPGALEVYEQFVRVLAHELEEEPSAAIQALGEELRRAAAPTPSAAAEKNETDAIPAEPPVIGGMFDSYSHPVVRRARSMTRRLAVGALTVAAVSLAVALWRPSSAPSYAVDGNAGDPASKSAVAIMPFRTAGASNVGYLREGMLDLLALRLGASDSSVVDPQATLVEEKKRRKNGELTAADARETARKLGARYFVTGAVTGNGGRVIIEATMRAVRNDSVLLVASEEGAADSVGAVVDRIAAQILFARAGFRPLRPAQLTRKPIANLHIFLRGQAALHQGRYADAQAAFAQVVATDSTFSQAALGLAVAAHQVGGWGPWRRGLDLAWRNRAELGRSDSLYLVALAGPRHPSLPTHVELLDGWNNVVEAAPNRADAWYELGDALHAWGPVTGSADPESRARAALARALQLDSTLVGPVSPLVDAAIDARDSATVRALNVRYVAGGSTGESLDYLRWRIALFLGDEATLRQLRRRFDRLSEQPLLQIIGMAQVDGVGREDGERALAVLGTRVGNRRERNVVAIVSAHWALNHGRPADAVRARRRNAAEPGWSSGDFRALALEAMYAGGDTAAGAAAVRELDTHATLADTSGYTASKPHTGAVIGALNTCVTEQWRAWRGNSTSTAKVIRMLRTLDRPEARSCMALIAAIDGTRQHRPNAAALLDSLDVKLRAGDRPDNDEYYGNIALARLWEERGEFAKALAAAQRRPHNHWEGPWYLREFLTTQKRLAARVGDRAAETRAAIALAALDRAASGDK